ncbi:hypothetical protein ACQKM9_17250 [Viridibacillus sp. NPDC093762]|uniref:hypothetical protein n=1 Tax=Viridibacillus sp. NPDC093762 TaxID=3390720 RepID=UPI003CFD86DF
MNHHQLPSFKSCYAVQNPVEIKTLALKLLNVGVSLICQSELFNNAKEDTKKSWHDTLFNTTKPLPDIIYNAKKDYEKIELIYLQGIFIDNLIQFNAFLEEYKVDGITQSEDHITLKNYNEMQYHVL